MNILELFRFQDPLHTTDSSRDSCILRHSSTGQSHHRTVYHWTYMVALHYCCARQPTAHRTVGKHHTYGRRCTWWLDKAGWIKQDSPTTENGCYRKKYKKGILAWYDCHLSTGKVEGINNKIKVMKRNAYGFRDERYFTLRLYALHDCRITRNVGWTSYKT